MGCTESSLSERKNGSCWPTVDEGAENAMVGKKRQPVLVSRQQQRPKPEAEKQIMLTTSNLSNMQLPKIVVFSESTGKDDLQSDNNENTGNSSCIDDSENESASLDGLKKVRRSTMFKLNKHVEVEKQQEGHLGGGHRLDPNLLKQQYLSWFLWKNGCKIDYPVGCSYPVMMVIVLAPLAACVLYLASISGTIVPASDSTLWKKRASNESNESNAYIKLMNDPLSNFVAKFYREVEYKGDLFIEIEDLTRHFNSPAIMDVKIGTRTFLESEVNNPAKRADLYKKMIAIDGNEPTEEEHADKAITKLRYMQFRERESSTAEFGFRIEAIKFIGSSLLFMYDKKHANVWMIDFAKVCPVETVTLNHTSSWQFGNHEDGYFVGLDNLIQVRNSLLISFLNYSFDLIFFA
ncbi:inositol-trisphosphate 3-kinase B [Trichinella spiralis]|uniref:inositol-trisphosphate 3-kinase B n=1 Tax=Trichinella spiralis TaxID=6334 RepID=UPI0001EFE8B5|nr:inositol-trisphosphate 3-kinase B [Trichinella spiralis]